MEWTLQEDEVLRTEWNKGLSSRRIGAILLTQFGNRRSSSGVIGRASRLGLPKRAPHTVVSNPRQKPKDGKEPLRAVPLPPTKTLPSSVDGDARKRISKGKGVKFFDLGSSFVEGGHCRFPLTDVKKVGIRKHLSCGNPIGKNTGPYCPDHAAITYGWPVKASATNQTA